VGHTVWFAVFSLLVSPSGATSFTTALQATTTAQVTATVAETTAAGTTTFSNPSCSDVLVNIKGLGGEMTIGGVKSVSITD